MSPGNPRRGFLLAGRCSIVFFAKAVRNIDELGDSRVQLEPWERPVLSGIVGVTNELGRGSDGLHLRVPCCRSYGRDGNLQSEVPRITVGVWPSRVAYTRFITASQKQRHRVTNLPGKDLPEGPTVNSERDHGLAPLCHAPEVYVLQR